MLNIGTPTIQPWKRIPFDPLDGGSWIVAGDIDGDGEVEVITARNVDINDVHYTCTVAAYKLDGTRLWRWGGPGAGRGELHHDVACQIYDWDGDGKNEVIVCDQRELVELDGATGHEKRRLPLPAHGASDCIVFCNLSGGDRPTDVLVKTRYSRIWAFNRDWKQLWSVEMPGGHQTAHQPLPMDIDGDGLDEILAGYVLLNADGSQRWHIRTHGPDLARGHLDCCRVVRTGAKPEDWRLVLTYCGALVMAMIDGTGQMLWALTGEHFESVDVGKIVPGQHDLQLAVDIDKAGWGSNQLWVISEKGEKLSEMTVNYGRHHDLLDWNGKGTEEIIVGAGPAVFDHSGKRLANFAIDPYDRIRGVFAADMTGNGAPDVLMSTWYGTAAYVFKNEHGIRTDTPLPLGTGANVTLY